jgi:DNA-binding MarR family transcriptional regulator
MSDLQTRATSAIKECLATRIRLLNRVLTQVYDTAFRPLGLKSSQFSILLAAAEHESVLPHELCDALQIDSSTLSRNLERMRARGWLEVTSSRDGREQPFQLSDAGKELLEKALPLWADAQQQATVSLGEMGVALLKDSARRVVKAEQAKQNS